MVTADREAQVEYKLRMDFFFLEGNLDDRITDGEKM